MEFKRLEALVFSAGGFKLGNGDGESPSASLVDFDVILSRDRTFTTCFRKKWIILFVYCNL